MRFGPRFRSTAPISSWMDVGRRIKVINAASDTISGGYRIITFHADGELVIYNYPLSLEYLVVGGGGGGGSAFRTSDGYGGGGGAGGGVLTNMGSPIVVQPGKYNIKVGAGGETHVSGGISSFSNIAVALGGGAGSVAISTGAIREPGFDGASGGGGSGIRTVSGSTFYVPGRSLYSQGFKGGAGSTGVSPDIGSGGGGGGAGAVGSPSTSGSIGGAGGAGVANSITGSSVTYGGGGGGGGTTTGGAAGSGGGGAGGSNNNGSNGTANLGGGGGGAATTTTTARTGGSGGSGIVIVRFPAT